MEPALYRAAMEGNVEKVNKYTTVQLESQITPQSNNILHVAAMFGHREFVKLVLQKCPHLMQTRNNKLETPLHISAKKGYPSLLQIMLDHQNLVANQDLESVSKSSTSPILRAENSDGDTALHIAARAGRSDVVDLLAKAYPESCSLRNKDGKTPLYIAAERNYSKVVLTIMENCDDLKDHGGPDGKTTLHAAVYQIPRNPGGCIGALLSREENTQLIEVADAHGWLPIHYAAYFGSIDGVIQFLCSNGSTAYKTTEKNGKFTAIHIAAANGNVATMKVILYLCPDCWETVDSKGRNILDIARYMEEEDIVEYIQRQPWSGQIINETVETSRKDSIVESLLSFVFSKMTIGRVQEYHDYLDPHVSGMGSIQQEIQENANGDDVDLMALWKSARKEGKEKRLEKQKIANNNKEKMAETHLIVAALIATVTFAANFSLPGGYNGNEGPDQGFAVLVRLTAFEVFTISNSIAVSLSLTSVLLYFFISFRKEKKTAEASYWDASIFIMYALLAMVIAFIAGSFTVLKNSSGLATASCVICCLPILVMFFQFNSLNKDSVVYLPQNKMRTMYGMFKNKFCYKTIIRSS